MKEPIYAAVGSFAMRPGTKKGVHIFKYCPEDGTLVLIEESRPEINAGQGTYDKKRDVLYITHESKDRDGEQGGGGRILACRINRVDGTVCWIDEMDTLAALPSYVLLEGSGKYLLIPHHATGNVATKTRRRLDGTYEAVTECDDSTLLLVEAKEDGRFGEILDVVYHDPVRERGRIKKIPHLHCIVQSPDGELFLACDKGLDCIHGYRLDRKSRALEYLGQTFVEEGAHPRYGVFHPQVPVFYQNCENSAYLHVWKYDSQDGRLERIQKLPAIEDESAAAAWTKEGASDLAITPNGRYLYASVRGLQLISVFEILEDGSLHILQTVDCQGENPRGLCLSPDGRYLYSINRDSENIARFKRREDGTLEACGIAAACSLPGNMHFLQQTDQEKSE